MAELRIAPIPVVAEEDLRPLFAAMLRIDQANHWLVHGHLDLCSGSAEAVQLDYLHQDDFRCLHLLATTGEGRALEPDSVVGYGSIWTATRENLDTALVGVCVDPVARGRGVGAALLAALEDHAARDGRSLVNTWSIHPAADGEGPRRNRQAAAHGPGHLDADDPTARFFLRRGYRLDQTHSNFQLDLPAQWEPRIRREEPALTSYEVVGWDGGTPPDDVAAMAALRTLMSTAAPAGSVEPEEQRWDADRVHRHDRERISLGLALHTVAARHRRSGQLVGYTELSVSASSPGLGLQGDTFVDPAHRGQGLGRVLKEANLARARQAHPLLRRVVTTNAGENAAMRTVNAGMGFREVSIDGNWQKVLGQSRPPSAGVVDQGSSADMP